MQSPLQVTIMATLLEDTGEPPQQRYRLFAEYYRTIYKRETRRKLLGGILTERQKDIDTIHARAGLMLQVAGEQATGRRTRVQTDDIDSALADDRPVQGIGSTEARTDRHFSHEGLGTTRPNQRREPSAVGFLGPSQGRLGAV